MTVAMRIMAIRLQEELKKMEKEDPKYYNEVYKDRVSIEFKKKEDVKKD